MRQCLTCGAENPDVARFCLLCGASVAADEAAGIERRIVTVIFVDLVGFTSRAERLDPEDVRAVLTPYHQRVRREIESFGGVVEKFIGDAVMGLFGAPFAHGDDAERAVRAALVIRDCVGELAGGDLQIRVAVNTGEAVVSLGARPALGESMVAGDVVNTAARLQAAAPINGVVVGEETYRETRDAIEYEPAEPVVAKGKEHPVRAWVALEPRTKAGERPLAISAIVGREGELAILRAFWELATRERLPHLVSIFGPAGVGKSTLAGEFAREVEDGEARVVRGRSLPYRESGAYGSLATQLMQLAGVFESDAAEVVSAKLRERSEELLAGRDGDPGARRRAPRRDRRSRRRRRGAQPRGALRLGAAVPGERGARAADDPRLRGHPLGRCQPARFHRDVREPCARPAATARDAVAARAARHATRLGGGALGVHGAHGASPR